MKLRHLIKSGLFLLWNATAMYLIRVIIPKYVVVSDNQTIHSFLTSFIEWLATGVCFVGIILGMASIARVTLSLFEGSEKESK